MTLRDLRLRVLALLKPRQVERDLDEELAFHVELATQKLMAQGMSAKDARRAALARFGPVALSADQCRDARGTAFVDSTVRDIQYAFRTFRRAPLSAATIVATVALGLGMITVAFTFYNTFFLRTDGFRNPSELFIVRRPPYPGAQGVWMQFKQTQFEELRRDATVFSDACAILLDNVSPRIDGRTTDASLVTGNFFQVLGADAEIGRTLLPEDDVRFASRQVIVLSHRGWTRLFGADPTVLGRHVVINGSSFEVIGVMPTDFKGLPRVPDYWAPQSTVGRLQPASAGKEDDLGLDVIGRLKPNVSAETATAELTAWVAANLDLKPSGHWPKTAMLLPAAATPEELLKGLLAFAPVFFAFGLILMIGCANVANLLLARGISRQREIGVRLSLGASRARIIRQLLTENLLLALLAAAGGLAILRLTLEAGLRIAASTMGGALVDRFRFDVPSTDWRVLLFLLVVAIASTVFFGLAPAFHATRLDLVRTMRGEMTKDARPSRWRGALIAVQVGASALLLISAAVFLRSAASAAAANPGLRTSDTVTIEVANEPLRAAMVQAVQADPVVTAMAASLPGVVGNDGVADIDVPNSAGKSVSTLTAGYQFVSPEYFDLLDIGVVKGRAFTALERRPEAGVVVFSESTARRLWPNGDAIGQVIHMASGRAPVSRLQQHNPDFVTGNFTVVGVVRDVRDERHNFLFASFHGGGVYLPASPGMPGMVLAVRVRGNPEQAQRGLVERLTKVDPALGAVTALQTLSAMSTYVLRVVFWVAAVLGGLALALTLSGIFSVLSYLVEQRRQEIGVRIALGASGRHVVASVLLQASTPVAAGLIAGAGLAGAVAAALMATRAASEIDRVIHVFDPVAYGASAICVIVACLLAALIPAVRASRIDPIAALKQD